MNFRPDLKGRWRWPAAVFIALSLFGCMCEKSPPPAKTESTAPEQNTGEEIMAVTSLEVVDRAEYDDLLAENLGKVVLVDFWATWCAPCVKQLPHSFALAEQRRSEGLVVVTVCMEDPDEKERIQQFLESKESTATINLLSREGGSSHAMEQFEITGGALPHYKLYDRKQNLRHTFALDPSAAEQFSTEDIGSAVENLLAE